MGHANAAADAAAVRQAAFESEQRTREEAIQMQHQYLSEVENQAQEWKEQQRLMNQKAVQQTIQEQLRLKMEQLTEEAQVKEAQKREKQECQARPCANGHHHQHRILSQREREEQAQWEAKFMNTGQVPPLPYGDCPEPDAGPPPAASVVTTAPTKTTVRHARTGTAAAQPGGQPRSSNQPYDR